ncbi:hypothetical protein LguiB_014391 [Lonicera macranthoides]
MRFFTVYGPWVRPEMAYFVFTKDILERKPITIFEGADHGTVARDFTYIDDVVKGCLAALDNAKKSTGSGGKKKGKAQFRIFNFSKLVSILEKLLKVKANTKVCLSRSGSRMLSIVKHCEGWKVYNHKRVKKGLSNNGQPFLGSEHRFD